MRYGCTWNIANMLRLHVVGIASCNAADRLRRWCGDGESSVVAQDTLSPCVCSTIISDASDASNMCRTTGLVECEGHRLCKLSSLGGWVLVR